MSAPGQTRMRLGILPHQHLKPYDDGLRTDLDLLRRCAQLRSGKRRGPAFRAALAILQASPRRRTPRAKTLLLPLPLA